MKNIFKLALLGVVGLTVAACDVDQTKEAELPDVDVNRERRTTARIQRRGPRGRGRHQE